MMKRNEAILRPANRELIQSKARSKIKKYQDQISKLLQETKEIQNRIEQRFRDQKPQDWMANRLGLLRSYCRLRSVGRCR